MGYDTLIQFSQIEGESARSILTQQGQDPTDEGDHGERTAAAAQLVAVIRSSPSPTSLVLMAKIRRSRYQTDDEAYAR